MQTFDIELAQVGTGLVFPAQVEQMDWIGFHGTSSYYSPQIESDGFSNMAKPLAAEDVKLVVDLARRLGLDWERVDGFRQLKSISFSSVSEIALDYSRPNSLGGQGVGYVSDAVNQIIEDHFDQISSIEAAQLQSIRATIDAIRSSDPVIYAVDLKGLTRTQFQIITAGIYVFESIPPVRIIAKLRVSSPVNYDLINAKALREGIRQLARSREPHFTKLMAQG